MWGRLGKLLRCEGVDLAVSETFYLAVVQAVILFGSETLVLLEPMDQRLGGEHVGFLWQVTGKKSNRLRDGLWRQVKKYIYTSRERGHSPSGHMWTGDRQQWRSGWQYRPIFDVCAREISYEGGERLQVPWRRQAVEKHLK